jgi:hypothetical protein
MIRMPIDHCLKYFFSHFYSSFFVLHSLSGAGTRFPGIPFLFALPGFHRRTLPCRASPVLRARLSWKRYTRDDWRCEADLNDLLLDIRKGEANSLPAAPWSA